MESAPKPSRFAPTPPGTRNWSAPEPEEMGRWLPGYEMLSLLGCGGMGAVYLALQTALDRSVAIKVLPLENSADEAFALRFTREARTMARLKHPHIVSVYEFGKTTAGHLYFLMEFVDGESLQAMIYRGREADGTRRGLPVAQALEMAGQVCEALEYAHAQGVVHRDIKPANIMVDPQGLVKVTDFGIARVTEPGAEQFQMTQTGTVVGTADYIAPEQLRGEHVDHRADLYSLGVMLYEMLCGEVPRGAFAQPSSRVNCPRRVDDLVRKVLQPDPGKRHQSAAEFKAELDTVSAALRKPAAKSSPRWMGGFIGAAAVAVFGYVAWSRSGKSSADHESAKKVAATPAAAPLSTAEANRRLAEWVLEVGDFHSYVDAKVPGMAFPIHIDAKEKIPEGEWEPIGLWLDRGSARPGLPPAREQDFVALTAGLTHLKMVFIRDAPMSDSAFAFLAQNTGLEELHFESENVSDAVLGYLAGLKKLRVLDIDDAPKFSGRELESLQSLPVLTDALFYKTKCGDEVAQILSACPKLRQAHMEETVLTDAGLAALARVGTLQKVLLRATKVTDAGVAAFRQARPGCEVVR